MDRVRPWLDHYPAGVDWNAVVPEAPLHTLLTNAAARFPNRPAYNFFGRRTRWKEAAEQATRMAAGLQRLGLAPGDRVGLLLPNCPAYPTAFFGALMAGLVVVNFNPLYSPRELEHQARDAGLAALVTLDLVALYPKAAALLTAGLVGGLIICPFASMLPGPKRVLFQQFKRKDVASIPQDDHHVMWASLQVPGTPAPVACEPRTTLAVLQYTGGTSGKPKGAMLSHANLYANTMQGGLWFNRTRPGQEIVLAALPFFHVFAMTTVLLFSVAHAAEIVMLPRFELSAAIHLIARRRPTFLPGVPTMFNAIASAPGRADLRSIRYCISGGAPLPAEVKARFEARTGCVVVEGYGLTETSPCVISNPPGGLNKPGIGLPIPQTDAVLRDPADPARTMPPGERGELCLRGPQIMMGYWQHPEETAASTTPDGYFRTGDIATMDEDGYFAIVDRIKDLILAGGYNVYPRTVEDAIYQHSAVHECTVIGIPDAYRGETVKAFVVLHPGQSLDAETLQRFLKDYLSPIEMPKQIEFRAELPKTLIGKLSKKELIAEERARLA